MSEQNDSLAELGEAIEKAKGKGLMPKGGSTQMWSRAVRRMHQTGKGTKRFVRGLNGKGKGAVYSVGPKKGKGREFGRATRLANYALSRTTSGRGPQGARTRGVYKSIDALEAVIEKAGLIRGGSRAGIKRLGAAYSAIQARADSGHTRLGDTRAVDRLNRAGQYLAGRKRGRRTSVKVSSDRSPTKGRLIYRGKRRSGVYKAKPKTLYVYRPVENAADIIAWAQSQGFASTQPAEKLHVTLAFSKTPLNWAMLHDDYHLEPSEYAVSCGCESTMLRSENGGAKQRKISGGIREVKALGKDGAVVLAFESDSLTQRWMDFKRAGAAWSFPSFTPHLTLTYEGGSVDLSKVHPYAGDIILGEECWEEVDEKGQEAAIAAEKGVKKALTDLVRGVVAEAIAKPAAEAA